MRNSNLKAASASRGGGPWTETRPASIAATDTARDAHAQFVAEAARYLLESTLCLCLHCLTRYCTGSNVEAGELITAIHDRGGTPPLLIPHEDNGRRWSPVKTRA